jgi:hypothetical protein
MAAGAIPPPLFFERRRHLSIFASGQWHTRGHRENNTSVDLAFERPARFSPTTSR